MVSVRRTDHIADWMCRRPRLQAPARAGLLGRLRLLLAPGSTCGRGAKEGLVGAVPGSGEDPVTDPSIPEKVAELKKQYIEPASMLLAVQHVYGERVRRDSLAAFG